MPSTKRSSSKLADHSHHEQMHKPFNRAPFGFVFFLLLLVTTFAFSSFYVISQTAREDRARNELIMTAAQLESRLNNVQGQVNRLSAELTIQQEQLQRLMPKTATSTLPTAGVR